MSGSNVGREQEIFGSDRAMVEIDLFVSAMETWSKQAVTPHTSGACKTQLSEMQTEKATRVVVGGIH